MKIGISTFATDETIRPDVLAKAAEERGFESLFLAEHSHIPRGTTLPDGSAPGREYYRGLDPFLALTAAASATERLRLGTGIAILVQRDVIHTAKEVATLDLLSGGRVLLAVGAGWNEAEMRNHGVDPRTRGRLMDEQLAALKAIWTEEETSFHGEHVNFGPIHQWPKPVQRPHPPIYIGGHSRAARRRVIEHGDGWFPLVVAPEDVQDMRSELAARERTGVVMNVPADENDLPNLDRFAEAGADRATFHLEALPESAALRKLDELAALITRYSS
ncbi:probable F420-dependent oxidoreductase, Rv2161c family [Saccharopolyspora antimicrobica]|uniref:F420-dependent oxidoreductase n=1 Tax=Saccharopolyspora antimicrobica TaxID=455193 RepID=A0A1I4R1T1_9PSEU|nr:LLM class F420-dependent oxidoreductase [Saccharopolyspora antimicrobica]RKT88214.1 putative F420-dependent oxidoreductase [Saccharopolyspora antimicrobica]SFM45936.1 probable F420-dependent oxidoreductase, Rv2161c family [Saccharopolyspora antimicrobica]